MALKALILQTKKERSLCNFSLSLRGSYLLSHLRSTIGVVRFNFSVRDGKRWSPDAIATLIFLDIMLALFKELSNGKIKYLAYPLRRKSFGQLVSLGYDITAFTPATYLRHSL